MTVMRGRRFGSLGVGLERDGVGYSVGEFHGGFCFVFFVLFIGAWAWLDPDLDCKNRSILII